MQYLSHVAGNGRQNPSLEERLGALFVKDETDSRWEGQGVSVRPLSHKGMYSGPPRRFLLFCGRKCNDDSGLYQTCQNHCLVHEFENPVNKLIIRCNPYYIKYYFSCSNEF